MYFGAFRKANAQFSIHMEKISRTNVLRDDKQMFAKQRFADVGYV